MEKPAVDVARPAAFYERVFGWRIRGDGDERAFDDAPGAFWGGG